MIKVEYKTYLIHIACRAGIKSIVEYYLSNGYNHFFATHKSPFYPINSNPVTFFSTSAGVILCDEESKITNHNLLMHNALLDICIKFKLTK